MMDLDSYLSGKSFENVVKSIALASTVIQDGFLTRGEAGKAGTTNESVPSSLLL